MRGSAQRNLPVPDPLPRGSLGPGLGVAGRPCGIPEMGCPAPPARPQLSGSCPLPSRFQTFRPGAPPPPGATAAVPPSPVPRSVPPRKGGEGTPGLSLGGPGPPTPSPSGLSLPRGGRMWAPGGRPEPSGPGTSPGREPARAPRSRVGRARPRGRTRGRAAGRPEPTPEPEPEPEPDPGGRS